MANGSKMTLSVKGRTYWYYPNQLRNTIERSGMSLTTLAKEMGVHGSRISHLVSVDPDSPRSRKTISGEVLDTILKIVGTKGVDVEGFEGQ